jgi:hypothetical protein
MNYKSAITEASKEMVPEQKIQTRLERVIKYSPWPEKPGWIKISYAWEEVPIHSTSASEVPPPSRISLEHYVRLQERRKKEYDAVRWPGAFRETFLMDPSHSEQEQKYPRKKHRPRNFRVAAKNPSGKGRQGQDSPFEEDPENMNSSGEDDLEDDLEL